MVPDLGVGQVVGEGSAGRRQGVGIEQVRDLLEGRQKATGAVEVVHQEAPGGFEIDEQRHARADPVEVVEGQRDAETAGDREQVDDRVRRSAQHAESDDRVAEGAGRHDLARAPVVGDHLDGEAAGLVRSRSESASGAGRPAVPGIVMPSASASRLIVDAVPIVLQWPRLRIIDDSDSRNACSEKCRPGPPR